MKKEYIDIVDFPAEDYQPLIDYESWRVAVLRYCENVKRENIKTMQKHEFTDEVFVLLDGNCTLLCGGNGLCPREIEELPMEPMRAYNVKKGTWHNHTLDEKGAVLIIENRNTCDDNSPILPIKGS